MKKLPIAFFLTLLMSAVFAGITSYHRARCRISEEVNHALAMTMNEMPTDVVTADTIRCYRSHIATEAVRERACIAVRTTRRGKEQGTELVAQAECGMMDILRMSDQRASGSLLAVALLWLAGSMLWMRRHETEQAVLGVAYGGLFYNPRRAAFLNAAGEKIHLTPMQQQLMEMFWQSPDHSLPKETITSALWPKKPDANDTLYTLVRRIKPILEEHSQLKIESDRGKSYTLEIK